jgi:hypothetical protein
MLVRISPNDSFESPDRVSRANLGDEFVAKRRRHLHIQKRQVVWLVREVFELAKVFEPAKQGG